MPRDYQVTGEVLVQVKGGEHLSGGPIAELSELGLADNSIRIQINYQHTDLHADDFGPTVPPEVLWQLGDANITMGLVHYDPNILDICLNESASSAEDAGTMNPAGTPLGNYSPIFSSGNTYISLNFQATQGGQTWHFPATYLTGPPIISPIGTERTIATLNWRAIPYVGPTVEGITTSGGIALAGELSSSGAILFDRTTDT